MLFLYNKHMNTNKEVDMITKELIQYTNDICYVANLLQMIIFAIEENKTLHLTEKDFATINKQVALD